MTQAHTSTANHLVLDTALRYIAGGLDITPVHPPDARCKSPGKQPLLDSWQSRHLSVDEFRGGFRPGCNIGVVTGARSGLVCLDLDGEEGQAWFYDNEHRLGHAVTERRGTTSLHLYYRYPAGVPHVPSRKLTPKVEVKADGGHQVVTWPSVHPGGEQYLFDNGLSLLDVAHESDELPHWVLDLLLARESRLPAAGVTAEDGAPPADHPADVATVRRIYARVPPAVEGHGGDAHTYNVACVARDYGLTEATALGLLTEQFNPRCRPPWPPEDLATKVQNAYRYANGAAGAKSVRREFPPLPDHEPAAAPSLVAELEAETAAKTYKTTRPTVAARLYLRRHANRVLCEDEQLYVYRRDRLRWEPVKDAVFQSLVARDIEAVNQEDHQNLKMTDLANIVRAVKIDLDDQDRRLKPGTWLDREGDLGEYVSLRNGIIDLTSGEILPHTPNYFSFTTLPFDYDPEARCPHFLSFLESVWDGDADMVTALRRWMGYLLLSDTRAQKFAVLIGESRGGKSTLARVMEALIGADNTAACSLTMFGGQFGLQAIWTKRLAIFNDAQQASGEKGKLAVERIISIVGNDPQPVELKYKDIVSAVLPTKIVFVCNAMPQFINTKGALTNRMVVFPFGKSFAGKEDPKLLVRLLGELPGILNWALEGVREILNGELPYSAAAGRDAVEIIGQMLDTVQGFVSDVVDDSADGAVVTIKELWAAYRQWCQDNGITHPKPKKQFTDEFRSLLGKRVVASKTPDKRRLDGFRGIRLNQDTVAVAGDFTEPAEEPPF